MMRILCLLLTVALTAAPLRADTGPYRPTLPDWSPTQSAGSLNEAWITLNGFTPFRVARHAMLDSADQLVIAYAIVDQDGALPLLPRRDLEQLAWALEMATAPAVLGEQPVLETLVELENSYASILVQHHRIRYWTEVQELAVAAGVYGLGAYFGGLGTLISAAPSILHNEVTNQLASSPRNFGMLFASSLLEAEQSTLRDQTDWLARRIGERRGMSAAHPLTLAEVQEAYGRALRIMTFMQPTAEFLVALQDDPGLVAQFLRLFNRSAGSTLALAPGASATRVGDLIAMGNLVEALELTVDGFVDFRAAMEANHAIFAEGLAGDGRHLPDAARDWVILNEAAIGAPAEKGHFAGAEGARPVAGTGEFLVSDEAFPVGQDFDVLAAHLFGKGFVLASWEDVKARYAREGGGFLRAAGMTPRGEDGPSSAAVSRDGLHSRQGGSRHYFIAWGEVPPSFLVHDRILHGNVPLNLGSWTTPQRVLARRTDPVPQDERRARPAHGILFQCDMEGQKRVEVARLDNMLRYRFIDRTSGQVELELHQALDATEIMLHARGASVIFTNAPNYEYVVGGSYAGVRVEGGAGVTVKRGGAHIASRECLGAPDLMGLVEIAQGHGGAGRPPSDLPADHRLVARADLQDGDLHVRGPGAVRLRDGAWHTLASWSQIAERYAREGGGFMRAAGLEPDGRARLAIIDGAGSGYGEYVTLLAWGAAPSDAVLHETVHNSQEGAALHRISNFPDDHPLLVVAQPLRGSAPTQVVTAAQLNVRGGPGTEHAASDVLLLGDQVQVLEHDEGWARIGDGQWVSGRFLAPASDLRIIVGRGETEIEGFHTELTFRILLDDRRMERAVLEIAVDGMEPKAHIIEAISDQDAAQITFISAANDIGVRRALRVTGDCLDRLRRSDTVRGVRGCALSGSLSNGRRTYSVGG